jgi:hypothetical protein
MITRINPPLPLETPKGRGTAHFVIDYSTEHSLMFVTFIDETGECWCFRNNEVRLQKNLSFGRESTSEITRNMGV